MIDLYMKSIIMQFFSKERGVIICKALKVFKCINLYAPSIQQKHVYFLKINGLIQSSPTGDYFFNSNPAKNTNVRVK